VPLQTPKLRFEQRTVSLNATAGLLDILTDWYFMDGPRPVRMTILSSGYDPSSATPPAYAQKTDVEDWLDEYVTGT